MTACWTLAFKTVSSIGGLNAIGRQDTGAQVKSRPNIRVGSSDTQTQWYA
jgi:hypothetical protein